MTEITTAPSYGTAPTGDSRSTRSTRTRRAASASRSTCSTRASTSTAACSRSPPGGKRVLHRRGAGRRRLAGRPAASTSTTLAAKRDTPVTGLTSYPVQRRQLSVPKIGLYTNSADDPVEPAVHRRRARNISGTARSLPARAAVGRLVLRGAARARASSSSCRLSTLIVPVTLGRPRPPTTARQRRASPRSSTRTSTIATTTGTPGGAHADGHEPAGVHQRRRQLRRHQRQRRQRGPHDRGDDAEHRAGERYTGLLTPGSTFDAHVRHDQPGRLGLRPRRLDLPRLHRQPGVRRRRRSAPARRS